MKNNRYTGIIAGIITIVLSSCGTVLDGPNSFSMLKVNMPYSQIDSVYSISNVKIYPTYEFEYDNQQFKAIVSPVINYVDERTLYNSTGQSTGSFTYSYRDPFFLIFKDKKIVAWGYLYEFKSDPTNKTTQFAAAIENGYKMYIRDKGDEYGR